ncbi:MAG: Dam family site-specific DNA-(adenine-N6)-methyltransferase [Cyanobacteria bacterium]|nr:Dam family site-specific DNA-(adenine-N6)-methyltransferase [Cyanobacteriota bacterium]
MKLRPFLKWVGGKRQLLPELRRYYPASIGRYFEPFVGSGAVFFDLLNRDRINGHGAVLGDDNADLIGCYRRVGHSLAEVLAALEPLAEEHARRGRECYLEVRDRRFNPMRAAWRDRGANLDEYPAELAAMLIYLNRTGYNGLFRVNASGEFNVPPGRYDKPKILDRALLTAASQALASPGVTLRHWAFDRVLDEAREGDFVYFDPPYAPVSATANFRAYTGRGFSDRDQETLQRVVIELARRGVNVLLSNSTAASVAGLYENNRDARDAGLGAVRVPARRSINSNATRRGAVEELVVSNVEPPEAAGIL